MENEGGEQPKLQKIHEVPVIIRDFDDSTALGVAMIENLQRSDLNIIEEAEGYRSLMLKYEYTQENFPHNLVRVGVMWQMFSECYLFQVM